MRLYQEGEWYDAIPPGALYEYEFEDILMQHRDALFPGFKGARFNPTLTTHLGNVQADMILVDAEYRTCYVVEVELSTHPLNRHVLPQIEKIAAAKLGDQHADWLCARQSHFDNARLRALFRDVPHSTVLLANGPTPHWDDGLRTLPGIYRALVEVFRSPLNRTILRVNGVQPEGPGDLITGLTPGAGLLKSAYRVAVPSSIGDEVTAMDTELGADRMRFRVRKLGSDKYLFPSPAFELPTGNARLFRSSTGNYRIEVRG